MAGIPDDVIREVRERADIVAIVGERVQLRKAGQNHKGLCPFHQEKTPSFNVNGDKRFFYCFGCQKKGDVFTFLMEFEGKSFVEAVEGLATSLGVDIPEDARKSAYGQRSEWGRLLEVNARACDYYVDQLSKPAGQPARDYLSDRGITAHTAKRFSLGFAPDGWHELGNYLAEQNVPREQSLKLGLAIANSNGRGMYDRFRDRLMCPVMLLGGEVAGFSGRRIHNDPNNPKQGAKYINSPESVVYKKSRLLFGARQAKEAIRKRGRAILVEGNFDVISLHQAGFEETVAPLGTALTAEQVERLRRLTKRVVLLYDGDTAGRAASRKSLEALLAADVEVHIARLSEGDDPDSIVKQHGPEALATVLDRAQPGVEYFIHEVWSAAATSADGRAAALAEAASVLGSVANRTKRDLLIGTLASALGIDEALARRSLRDAHRRTQPQSNQTVTAEIPVPDDGPAPREELEIISILADHPELLEVAEQNGVFSLLTDGRLRDMYSAARQENTLFSATETLSPHIAKHVLQGAYANVDDPSHCLTEAVNVLRRSRQRLELEQLQKQANAARRRGDEGTERQLVRQILTLRKQVN